MDGIACSGLVGSGIEQSFSRSVSGSQKEILGDDGECQTKIYSNAKADLTIEVIPTFLAAFPSIGTVYTVSGSGKADIIGSHTGKYILTGGIQESTVDGESRYSFELEQYLANNLGA